MDRPWKASHWRFSFYKATSLLMFSLSKKLSRRILNLIIKELTIPWSVSGHNLVSLMKWRRGKNRRNSNFCSMSVYCKPPQSVLTGQILCVNTVNWICHHLHLWYWILQKEEWWNVPLVIFQVDGFYSWHLTQVLCCLWSFFLRSAFPSCFVPSCYSSSPSSS